MSDIVTRLRRWSHTGGCGCTRCVAATEIERLHTIETAARYCIQKEGQPVFIIALEELGEALDK